MFDIKRIGKDNDRYIKNLFLIPFNENEDEFGAIFSCLKIFAFESIRVCLSAKVSSAYEDK